MQEGAASREHDALLHDVRRQFGRRLVECDLDGVDDGRDRFLDGPPDLLGGGHDRLGQAGDQVPPPDLCVQLLFERPCRSERDLDLLSRALTERQAVLLLDVLDDGVVELVAADADRLAGDDAAQRDHGDLGGAAADVDDHVAGGLGDRQAGADGRGHGLFDDEGVLAGPRELCGLLHGPLLDAGDARRDADHHAGLGPSPLMHALDEVAQHLLGDLEVGDHAVLQRPDGHDVGGRAPDHALGLEPDRERTTVLEIDGDDGRLVQDNAPAPDIDESVRRAQVDCHVPAEQRREEAVGHAKRPTRPREVSPRG